MSRDLCKYSIEKLHEYEGQWPELARSFGYSYSWICKFAANKIKDPGYYRVQKIADYFDDLEAVQKHTRRKSDRKKDK